MDDQLKQITERKTPPEDSSLILALAMLELTNKVREHNDTLKTLDGRLNSLQEQIRYLPLIVKLGIGMVTLILTAVGMAIMGWFLKG
jgi:CII-binding regulator of phage lambda lysogenization HflD